MVAFNKYEQFAVDLSAGVHVLTTAGSLLKVSLTNTAPTVATDAILTNITEISYTNITESAIDVINVGSETPGGTWDIAATNAVWNATGASETFQYVVLWNDTPAGPVDPLIGWWDYGSGVTLASGETFTASFGANILTIT